MKRQEINRQDIAEKIELDNINPVLKKQRKAGIVMLIISANLLLFTAVLWLLIKMNPDAFFPGFRTFSRAFMRGLAVVTSPVSFSVWDTAALLLVINFAVTLIVTLVERAGFLRWLGIWSLIVSLLACFAVDGWLLNHYAPPLSDELSLEVRKYSEEELYQATKYYMEKAAEYAVKQERDKEGELVRQDFFVDAIKIGMIYEPLESEFPVYARGSKVRVKKLSLTGNYYLKRRITGIFMPVSGEASVPEMDAVADLPFSMAHECAHRLGIASEEEANFSAYLACEASDDPYFLYSGYYNAYVYCHNKLVSSADKSWNEKLMAEAEGDEGCRLLFADAVSASRWYKSYEKEKAAEAMEKANDRYLKTFSQDEGVKSYGEVVNDLIAWYLTRHAGEE